MNLAPAVVRSESTKTLLRCCAAQTAASALIVASLALWASSRSGVDGAVAALIVVAVCWLGAIITLTVTANVRGPNGALAFVLAGMIFRFAMPIGAAYLAAFLSPPLANAGIMGLAVAAYLATLAVETVLAVRIVGARRLAGRIE